MKVREAMTRDVYIANPQNSIKEVARVMGEIDCGAVPIEENDRLVGMLTDRDIAVRAVGQNKGPDTHVAEVMTRDVRYCYEDEDLEQVTRNMADQQIRRLPVVNREKRLVGIISLGDLAMSGNGRATGEALTGISRPGGRHSQTGESAAAGF